MGYTHYWKHSKTFTKAQWQDIIEDIAAIMTQTQTVMRIPLSEIDITADAVLFNGHGEEGHETFVIERKRPEKREWQSAENRGFGFCKTAQKPYDVAVTACLIYLESVYPENYKGVSSDGTGRDWLAGLALVKEAVPRFDNIYDLPIEVMKDDRWKYDYSLNFGINESIYELQLCVNGKVYIMQGDTALYAFPDDVAAKSWIIKNKDDLYCGYSNPQNRPHVRKSQNNVFGKLIKRGDSAPLDLPAYVRPIAGKNTFSLES